MHKVKLLKILLIFAAALSLVSACGVQKPVQETENLDEPLMEMRIQLTKQAGELNMLQTQVSAGVAMECPTQVPAEPTEPCPECSPCEPCPTKMPIDNMPTGTASIRGSLSYPSQWIPPQNVYAIEVNTGYYYWVRTGINENSYKISGLPAGTYVVISYTDGSLKAAYSNFAACAVPASCTADHELIEIEIADGEQLEGINPIDWYNPEYGTWPDEPGR